MSPDDAHGAADADFRNAVDAEIEVLLQVWEEEMQRPDVDSRYRSATCQRLSVLLESAPDLLRSVLVTMDEALTEHVAIRVRRIGAPTLEVALACAFDGDEALRPKARRVLRRVLGTAPDQNFTDKAHRLPLHALGQLRFESAADLLIELVDDVQVRPQAISALGGIGGEQATSALKEVSKNPNKKIARLAANAFYGGQHTPRPPYWRCRWWRRSAICPRSTPTPKWNSPASSARCVPTIRRRGENW